MTPLLKPLIVIAVGASWLLPPVAIAGPAGEPKATAQYKKPSKSPSKKSTRWTGYGFLPGYRQPPALTEWRDRSVKHRGMYRGHEQRFVRYSGYGGYGQLQYGWGEPGIHRGRWNGGSFGPCYASTPIGMMWTCGK
jgi:hypothetical protein